MNASKSLPILLLIVLATIWGSSFILMKEGLKCFSGVQVAALRITIGGSVFIPFIGRYLKRIEKADLKYAILAGVIGNGIPAFLFAIGQQKVDSSIAGVLNALTPIFTIIIGLSLGVIDSNRWKIAGVVIGLSGAVAIMLGKPSDDLAFNWSHLLMIVVATFLYGANINLIKAKLSKYPSIVISALPLFFISLGGIFILVFSGFFSINPADHVNYSKSFGAIALLALLGNSLSLILFNRLIQISGPVFASSVTYLIPIVAVIWGLWDGEVISLIQSLGLLAILAGVYMINRVANRS